MAHHDLIAPSILSADFARLGAEVGLSDLRIKNDGLNPSGSLKDRASFLVVAEAARLVRPGGTVAFTDWMGFGLPFVVIFLPVLWVTQAVRDAIVSRAGAWPSGAAGPRKAARRAAG